MPPYPRFWKPGNFVAVPLRADRSAFGRVLAFPLMAFYSTSAAHFPGVAALASTPVLFRLWVMRSAVSSGRWPLVGWSPLTPEETVEPCFFKQDPISGQLSLYSSGQETPATAAQCAGLERAAVWGAEHVEARLSDHFAGRPNRFVDSLRLNPGGA